MEVKIKEKWPKIAKISWPYVVFAVIVGMILEYQIRKHTAIVVSDGYFHFSRFYDAAMQIKHHNFSYFQMNYSFHQSGRIINALYGPFLAYLMGVILLVAGTWLRFQIITTFIISFLAAVGMYKCSLKVSKNQIISALIALIYITQINLWSNGSTFNSISSMLMPYVLLCAIRMVTNFEHPINWLQLGITMSVVIQIHVISTILAIILLIPFFIIGLVKSTNKKSMLLNLAGAVGITILLTMNIWIAMIYFHSSDMASNPAAVNMAHATLKSHRFTILTQLIILVQVIYVVFNLKKSWLNTIITIFSLMFLFIASKYFPWDAVQHIFPVLREAFQFPRRLFIIIWPLILTGIAMTATELIQEKRDWLKPTVLIILSLAFVNNYTNLLQTNYFYTNNSLMWANKTNRKQRKAVRSTNLGKLFKDLEAPAPDYLPQVKKTSSKRKVHLLKKLIKSSKNYKHTVLSRGRLKLTWKAKNNKKVALPIVMYKKSQLIVNEKKIIHPHQNSIGRPTVKQKKGNNSAILQYLAPRWWSKVILVTILFWIVIIIFGVWRKWINKYEKRTVV